MGGHPSALRAVLYLRQSKTREDSISLELQERACRDHAQRKGYAVVAVESDPGLSGGSLNRPAFQRTLRMVKQREADVIVLWKWSRFSRKRLDWYTALDLVESAGGSIESATEDIDTTTGVGRLSRGVLIELAAFERERISDQWKEVWQRRASLGLANNQPRFGYQVVGGEYLIDTDVAPALRQAYQRAVEGESLRSLALWLNALGHLTPKGNPWQGETLRQSLRNGFAAGLIKSKHGMSEGRHEPIIDRALWDAFMGRQSPRGSAPRTRKHLWSGMLRCHYCGSVLYAHTRTDAPNGTHWVCGRQDRMRDCPGGGVTAWAPSVAREVRRWLAQEAAGEEERYRRAVAEYRSTPPREVAQVQRQLARVENDLLALARKNLEGFYDDQTYLLLRADLLDQQRILSKQQAEHEEPQRRDFDTILQAFDSLAPLQQRHALTLVIAHVTVRKRPDNPKYEVVPRWVVHQ